MSGLCAGRTIGGRVSGRRHRGVKGGRVAERVRVREVSHQEGTRLLRIVRRSTGVGSGVPLGGVGRRPRRRSCSRWSGHRAMVSETTPMVLAKGHNARWPLTSLHSSKSWTFSRRRRLMTHSPGRLDHLPGPDRGRAHQRDRRCSASAQRGAAGPAQRPPARVLTTTAGDLELRIPKLRAGSFFPSLLERRRWPVRGFGRVLASRRPRAG
jgi:Transposase, Mutator family